MMLVCLWTSLAAHRRSATDAGYAVPDASYILFKVCEKCVNGQSDPVQIGVNALSFSILENHSGFSLKLNTS